MADGAITLKAGDILFVQGENPSGLFMLQEGTLEILSASDEYDGLDRSIIISKSVRVGLLSGRALLSGFSAHLTGAYRKSVRAMTDASLARYPLPRGGI